ncbi:MAG: hypothetical protein QOK17_2683 [Sphingomonadales bacterium]|jgi:hypothetical protein|nr:hypothetical protein [Sphingomonadales bacterium]
MQAIFELLQHVASPWGVALGSVIALCTLIGRIVTTRYKTRAGIIAAETAQLVSRIEQDRLTLIATREQDRLDRAAEMELKLLTLQIERRPAEQELPPRRAPERPQISAPKAAAA